MNTPIFRLEQVEYLTSPAGVAALDLARSLPLTPKTLLTDIASLRRSGVKDSAAVVETVVLQRRATAHWQLAANDVRRGWLFTAESLEQASAPPVSTYRVGRIAAACTEGPWHGVHDVTCSIGADLAVFASEIPFVVGSDIDAVRLAMARINVRGSGAHLLQADARTSSTRGVLRYGDPARRTASGRRITSANTVPSVQELLDADSSEIILRLPPGIDYDTLDRTGEIDIVSLDGSVREAISWPRSLATTARRATVIRNNDVSETVTSDDDETDAITPAGRYIIDPDGAVVRAHLVTHYAARHQLSRLDPHLAYLTGDTIPPHTRGFEVLDQAPYSVKTLRKWVAAADVGTLEIKQRGTSVVPDELRVAVKPRGDRRISRTVIIARIHARAQMFWTAAHAPT